MCQLEQLVLLWIEAVMDADFVVTCTGRDEDMMEIVFAEQGMITHLKKGSIFIDHTTTSYKLAKHLNESLAAKGVSFIDAPVSGDNLRNVFDIRFSFNIFNLSIDYVDEILNFTDEKELSAHVVLRCFQVKKLMRFG